MAEITIAQLEKRVDGNGELLGAIVDKLSSVSERQLEVGVLQEEIEKLKAWMGNGLSEKMANMIAHAMTGVQNQWLKELFEAQRNENREYGKRRDEERTAEAEAAQKAQDRKMKFWSIIIPSFISAGGIIAVALIARGGA